MDDKTKRFLFRTAIQLVRLKLKKSKADKRKQYKKDALVHYALFNHIENRYLKRTLTKKEFVAVYWYVDKIICPKKDKGAILTNVIKTYKIDNILEQYKVHSGEKQWEKQERKKYRQDYENAMRNNLYAQRQIVRA